MMKKWIGRKIFDISLWLQQKFPVSLDLATGLKNNDDGSFTIRIIDKKTNQVVVWVNHTPAEREFLAGVLLGTIKE